MYDLVDIMRQKDDLDFAHLLNRLRLNEMTEEDKNKLQTFIADRDTSDYPKDVLHLFAENLYVNEHNDKILSHMPGEKMWYHVMTVLSQQTFQLKSASDYVSS